MAQFEIIQFYLDLVRRAQERGIVCAITSGMACVAYDVADATKDCDLLCEPEMGAGLLRLLLESPLAGNSCRYRGNISPPLDARWHLGGWTSHFEWPGTEAYLDVFGIAPRARSPWQEEMLQPYAHPHVVADMKRTARDKDWPFINELGLLLLDRADPRGWLHLYDGPLLQSAADARVIPQEMIRLRPVLRLAVQKDPTLREALAAEMTFWKNTSEARLKYYERHLKPYLVAVRKAETGLDLDLLQQHTIRTACAEENLPFQPLGEAQFAEMIDEARATTLRFIHPGLAEWLPDIRENYRILIPALR